MECNKEEAFRAKQLAEMKMQNRDFSGAKKIALKAQQLYAELENISQMITVCDVHCCADSKVNGQTDWYGILQIEQTADDASIKKQYRRLALQLHPDKNKFPGAEAAFKLIGEANMTLSDKTKRSFYDMKRRSVQPKAVAPRKPAQQRHPNMTAKSVNQNANTTYTFGNVHMSSSNPQNPTPTFWTVCPNCHAKFQYFRTLMNKSIPCHRCLKHYIASEISSRDVPQTNHYFAQRPNLNFAPRPNHNFAPQPNHNFVPQPNHNFAQRPTQNFFPVHNSNNLKQSVPVQPTTKNGDAVPANAKKAKASTTSTQKKSSRKKVAESSESECATDTEEDCEEIDAENGVNADNNNPGASHSAQHRKRSRSMNQTDVRKYFKEKRPKEQASNENEETSNVRSFSLPDSDFYNFEKERDPKKFAADQIWAVYDDRDAMPRFYVRIREVHDPFMLRFTWLENNPISELEQIWTSEDLPVACGNYRLGKSEVTKDLQMFSHEISWNKGTKRNTYEIYPVKGEVWAVFKDWDAKWTSAANNHRENEYEAVEVLSDSSDGSEFLVVHLVKVPGFVSLFVRSADERKSLIPRSEILRFSHRIPSYRVSKDEREGVPEGSFELDTGSLPENFEKTRDPMHADTASVKPERPTVAEDKCASSVKMENSGSKNEGDNNTNSNFCDLQPNEFYDFTNDRSIHKLRKGQIWALYSDIDQYPKFYAKIKRIDRDDIVITASWIELCTKSGDEANWIQKGLPATCGRFKVDRGDAIFESVELFSHIVQAESVGKREFDIYPQKGEIWALYKGWNINWTREDFDKCKYYIVEILELGTSVKVRMLTRVDDYNFVFKPEPSDMEIPLQENLRFSHRIPAIKLTDQVGGALHGYLELDSASVPNI